jgi:hypothetical protein
MNLLRRNLKNGVAGTLAGLFVVCLIFGLSVRTGAEQSYAQHCLTVIADHYYLLYFMLPLFLLMCFFVIEDDSEVVILRYKTYFRYFINKWLSLMVISLMFMATQLLAIALSGAGLPINDGWWIMSGSPTQELFAALSTVFGSPAICLAAASAYMFAGLCVTALIAMWAGHFLSRSWAIKVMILLYLLSVMSMRIELIRNLPITIFNHLVILHHNLTSPYRLTITAITAAVLVCFILWTAKKYWNRKVIFAKKQATGITPYYCKELISRKNIVILGVVVIVMVAWKYLQSAGNMNGADWITRLFAGHSAGNFQMLNFIELLLLNGAPCYLIAAFIEKATTEHSAFVTIRLKKRREILGGILTSAWLFIFLYGVFLVGLPILVMTVTGLTLDGGTLALLGLSVILKLLDIAAQFLFITAIYCLTGQIIIGFIGLVAANLLCIAPLSFSRYLPFGLSSLSRINLPQIDIEGLPFRSAICILLALNSLLVGWLLATGYKRLPKN